MSDAVQNTERTGREGDSTSGRGLAMPGAAVSAPLRAIDGELSRAVEAAGLPDALADAVRYAALGGGKRLRPLLAWHACATVCGLGEPSLPAGIAVELVHAFSLVHDDLPCMDDDDLRRGRPTLHRHAGEALALLAGDAMLALAFRTACADGVPHGLAARLCAELAEATTGMIIGQTLDIMGPEADGVARDVRTLELVHGSKTGALIRGSVRMGALCGLHDPGGRGAGESTLRALTAYGSAIGLLFQVVDDLLDVEQTTEQTGKRTGKDRARGKLTYPGVLGVEGSRAAAAELRAKAADALAPLGCEADGLRELAEFIAIRTK